MVTLTALEGVDDAGSHQCRKENSVGHERDEGPRQGRCCDDFARWLRRVRWLGVVLDAWRARVCAQRARGLRRARLVSRVFSVGRLWLCVDGLLTELERCYRDHTGTLININTYM
eukprot:3160207-Pleurochrysis_carterae.AAC.1